MLFLLPYHPQVMLVPIYTWRRCDRRALAAEVDRIRGALEAAGVRVAVDKRRGGPGVRFGGAELRGVPLRIEVRRERTQKCCRLLLLGAWECAWE